jgi:outer membrane protein assembly factor BamA
MSRFCVLMTWIACCLALCWGKPLAAQDSIPATSKARRNLRVIALPLVFYTPDTHWGFGASGLLTFNLGKDTSSTKRCSLLPGIAHTTLKQTLVWMPFQLFFKQQRYWFTGELDYFNYVYNYFGIGNGIPSDYIEKYRSQVYRIRLNALRALRPGLYGGLSYAFDHQQNQLQDSTGLLFTEQPAGTNGGVMSSLGLALNYDTRDNINFPGKGWLLQSELRGDGKMTGSDFRFVRVMGNASKYFSLAPKHVLALNGGASFVWGQPSFFQMSYLGGPNRLRGYYEGQFRDHHAAWLQAEYRSPFVWRLGAVAFVGAGTVFGRRQDWQLSYLRPNYGSGIRFMLDKAQRINLRLDYGFGYKASGFYLTFGEAF